MPSGAAPVSLKCTNCLKGVVGKHENVVSVQERSLRMRFGKLLLDQLHRIDDI